MFWSTMFWSFLSASFQWCFACETKFAQETVIFVLNNVATLPFDPSAAVAQASCVFCKLRPYHFVHLCVCMPMYHARELCVRFCKCQLCVF